MSKIVGYVTKIVGTFKAVDSNNHERDLSLGDPIYEGEKVSGNGQIAGNIVVALEQLDRAIELAGNEALSFDSSLFSSSFKNEETTLEDDDFLKSLVGDIESVDSVETAYGENRSQSRSQDSAEIKSDEVKIFNERNAEETDVSSELISTSFTDDSNLPFKTIEESQTSQDKAAAVEFVAIAKDPVMSISNSTVTEGNSNNFLVNVSSSDTPYRVTFNTTTDLTASQNDITPSLVVKDSSQNVIAQNADGSYDVPVHESKLFVSVLSVNDGVYEENETFKLNGKTEFMSSDVSGVGTILNDDTTSFSVSDASVNESGLMTFTVTRIGDAQSSQSIDFSTALSATNSTNVSDFSSNSGTLTFASGVTTQTFNVQTTQDTSYEGDETFSVTLTNNSAGSIITDATAVGTIVDNDTTSFSVADVRISEGGEMTFVVTRVGDAQVSQTVDFTTALETGDNASANDFTANAGTLTFASGVTTQTFSVQTTQDTPYEGSETFSVLLQNSSAGSTISDAKAVGTILDDGTGPTNSGLADDDRVAYRISDVSVTESGVMTFSVSRSGDASELQTIDFTTNAKVGDNASLNDYTSKTGTLTFAAGVVTQTFSVQTSSDNIYEGNETFSATLSNNSGNSVIVDAVGVGTIIDDDTTSFSVSNVSVTEGSTMTFVVTRVGDAEVNQTIKFTTKIENGNTADANDFRSTLGILTFEPGVTSKTITVETTDDNVYELDETFSVVLSESSLGSSITTAVATGTILNNDAQPTMTISDVSVKEGENAEFAVSLSASEIAYTVSFTTVDVTTNASDTQSTFVVKDSNNIVITANANGSYNVAAGETSLSVTVETLDDTIYEPDETFTLNGKTEFMANDVSATGTIVENDIATYSIDSVSISEGSQMTFTVTRTGDASVAQTIDYETVISGNDSASASDFTIVSGTLSFASNIASQTFVVQTTQDTPYEGSETFSVNISNSSGNSVISTASATGTILDDGTGPTSGGTLADDDRVGFRIYDANVSEGSTISFTVVRSGDLTIQQEVYCRSVNSASSTTDGFDFIHGAARLTFAAGVSSQTFTIITNQDSIYEGAETFLVEMTAVSINTIILTPTVIGTILDDGSGRADPGVTPDDDRAGFSISDVSISEGGLMTFSVLRSGAATEIESVDFATSIEVGDTAQANDFTGESGTLNFVSGERSKTFTIQTTQDTVYEGAEKFTVTLSNNTGTTIIANSKAVGTILDDGTGVTGNGTPSDDDRTSFSISDATIAEGGVMTFTVTRSGDTQSDRTVEYTTTTGAGANGASSLDFTALSGTLSFQNGSTSETFTINTTQDNIFEGNETFNATISNASGNAIITNATGVGTITDDLDMAGYKINNVSWYESGYMTFRVTREGDITENQTIDFTTAAVGDATKDVDYATKSGTLTFEAGRSTYDLIVKIKQDSIYEGSETFQVILSNNTGNSRIIDAIGVGTILDDGTYTQDDDRVSLSVLNVVVAEGNLATFNLSLDYAINEDITFTLNTTDGTATSADYSASYEVSLDGGNSWSSSSTGTISAGNTSLLVRVPTINDNLSNETPETFTLTATVTGGSVANTTASATATIYDDVRYIVNEVPVNGEQIGTMTFFANSVIDLSLVGLTTDIDYIDLSQNGDHKIDNLRLSDVVNLTDTTNELVIFGDSTNDVVSSLDTSEWTQGTTVIENNHTLNVFTGTTSTGESVTLKIEDDINQSII